ncbi:MAG TPA: ABC transporter substrate-binding protein [Castellaniella sp.]|uniref:ABC transporter substrate-binding protein n=1 Tax=Castellaniella sp. TaxID=1955812 RepID=UPI002F0426D3
MMKRISRRQFLESAALLGAPAAFPWLGAYAQAASATGAVPKKGGTLRISVDQAVSVINPLLLRVNPEYLVGELLYSGLTRLSDHLKAEPDLAKSWQANQDLTTWVFTLRKNIVFHDGTPCQAKDVEASIKLMLDPATASPARNNIGPIKDVRAVDDTHVEITTHKPYADLPAMLAYTNARIIPAALIEAGQFKSLGQRAVGTGPFKLVSYDPSRVVVVERNPHYYDPDRPYLDRVEVVVYPDPLAQTSALIAGDTDIITSMDSTEYPRVEHARGVVPLRTPSGQFLNVNMGCNQKPFQDARVRQALAACVDRKALVDFVANGYGTVGNDSPINSAYPFFEPVAAKTQDIAKAKSLLAAAGYPNGLDLTLIASDRPATRTQLGIALQSMAEPAGFRIKVQTMPQATYLDQVWKKGNFYIGFYNMQATVDAVFSLLYTSDASWNETHWNNKDFDALVEQARGTIDEKQRTELYGKAQQLMSNQVPSVIPLFFDILAGRRDYVQGYYLNPRAAVFRLERVWFSGTGPARR